MYNLRTYQSFAVEATINHFKYRERPAILDISVAGGKTVIAKHIIEHYAAQGKRILLLADREELLTQAGNKLSIPFNYFGAAFKQDDTSGQVTVGSIQSIYNKDFPPIDIIIVDECQGVPNNKEQGTYWEFINKHPQAKLLGLTGTPYRMSGKLTWGDIIYSVKYQDLLALGYVAPITNKASGNPDLAEVRVASTGDYVIEGIENVMLEKEMLDASVAAIIRYSHNRKKNLIFCVSVDHCNILQKALEVNGVEAKVVVGATDKDERRETLANFKSGELKHLITCELLLKGYDNPAIDMLTCLRPTMSKGLWEQLLGRAVRLFEGKENALLVDMSGNLSEHGPLGAPFVEKNKKEAKKSMGRICPSCETFCKVTDTICNDCDYAFPPPETPLVRHKTEADMTSKTIYTGEVETYQVEGVRYREHTSKAGNKTLRIDYICEGTKYGSISEWLSPWHENEWARKKVSKMFKERGHPLGSDPNSYSSEDLLWHCAYMVQPIEIVVSHAEKFPRILSYKYPDGECAQPKKDERSLNEILDDEIPF